jgi:type IV pilus assembly protein PilW
MDGVNNKPAECPVRRERAARAVGFTLVELMVAIVIGCVVVAAALALYAQGRSVYRVNERVARLQEQGRFALSVIEPDIELAGFYGFTNQPRVVRLVRGAAPETVVAAADALRQYAELDGAPFPAPVAGLPANAHVCGVNFAVDVMTPVQGSNDVFALGRDRAAGCSAYQGRAQLGADTLTLRRVQTQTSEAEAGRIQMYAARLLSQRAQLLFADGVPPGAVDADHAIHNFVVRSYYVARDSVAQRNFPALRVKSLTRSGSGVAFDEDEVMPGVEDLQVQFGIGTGEPAGQATRYVNPDFAELARVQVVAVRVWLRIRADEPEEVGFDDAQTYRYADVVYTPAGAERKFRRVLMSRTVAVRNARRA